jgi:ParB family chromosome partitioning protein
MDSLFTGLTPGAPMPSSGGGGITVVRLLLDEINDHHNHTFNVCDDEEMEGLTAAYLEDPQKVTPIHVRKSEKYGNPYECIAGHRRRYGARKAGLDYIYGIVCDMSDEESDILMVDSNIYTRQQISLREMANSLKVKYEARKKLAKEGAQGRSDEELAEGAGVSRATVQRLISLTKLNDTLFDFVEDKKITKETGEVLSGLKKGSQEKLCAAIAENGKMPKITKEMAEGIKVLEKSGDVSADSIRDILCAESAGAGPEKFRLTEKEAASWFPADYNGDAAAKKELIKRLLAEHFELNGQ